MKKLIGRIVVQILLVLLALSLFQAGSWWSQRGDVGLPTPTGVPLVVYQTLAEKYREETSGLRAALQARGEVQPREILRVDTVKVLVPDTVIEFVNVDSRGIATVGRLGGVRVTPQNKAEATAEILKGIDLYSCDDGITITPSSVVCDRPRLGHLYFFGSAFGTVDPWNAVPTPGFLGMAGIEWEPLYRSRWSIILGVSTEGRLMGGLHKRVEVW